ncbi:MAG: PHP domain-containing protein [Clostridia bacterium]|nr:PHP domain-containing protein [Clostridia bacterium]
MSRYYYDFHIHSCLSPCGDDDMTPANIAGAATLAGLNIVALTDHNTAKNCPAFMKAAKKYGIIGIAGMELTTAEDIHVVCLFENLEDALSFSDEIERHIVKIKNRPEIFGRQQIMDDEDNILGEEEFLLSNATDISVEDVPKLVQEFCGVCYPAHIDRTANGIVSILGVFPKESDFSAYELHNAEKTTEYEDRFNHLKDKLRIIGSDAHYLWDLRDAEDYIDIDDEPYSSELVRKRLFRYLRGEK